MNELERTRLAFLLPAMGAALALSFAGCEDDPEPTPDGGETSDGGAEEDGSRLDAAVVTNNSFEGATAITVGGTASDAIERPGDLDYFRFEGTAGQWLQIFTVANPSGDPEGIDTVITLYDSEENRIAENDDRLPRTNTDSEIITRLASDGTYYVLVQEWSTWDPDSEGPEGNSTYEFDLTILAGDDIRALPGTNTDRVNFDSESGDDAASAQAIVFDRTNLAYLLGTFDDDSDVDVFSFIMGSTETLFWNPDIFAAGPTELVGMATQPGRAWVTNEAGDEVIAHADLSEIPELGPALREGTYLFWIEHPGSAATANDYYVIKALRAPENPREENEEDNNEIATAEELELSEVGEGVRRAFIRGWLPLDDQDHYAFDIEEGEVVTIACGSRRSGSGVEGLRVVLTNLDGSSTIDEATESTSETALIEAAELPSAGTYVIRIEKSGQNAEVTGDWYRCGVTAAPPSDG